MVRPQDERHNRPKYPLFQWYSTITCICGNTVSQDGLIQATPAS
jgi:hypothetical protein